MVQLGFDKTHRNSVRKKLISAIVDPIGIGSLQLYPKLENLEKEGQISPNSITSRANINGTLETYMVLVKRKL